MMQAWSRLKADTKQSGVSKAASPPATDLPLCDRAAVEAPASSSSLMQVTLPAVAAACKGVRPVLF